MNEWSGIRGALVAWGWACGSQNLHPIAVSQMGTERVPQRFCTHVPHAVICKYLQVSTETPSKAHVLLQPRLETTSNKVQWEGTEFGVSSTICSQGGVTPDISEACLFFPVSPLFQVTVFVRMLCHLLVKSTPAHRKMSTMGTRGKPKEGHLVRE